MDSAAKKAKVTLSEVSTAMIATIFLLGMLARISNVQRLHNLHHHLGILECFSLI
jgi:hypothetical protein